MKVGTANIKDITSKLIDAQTESSCSQLKHLEKQSTALRQTEVGNKQTDIYIFFEGITKEKPELFLMKKCTTRKMLKQDSLPTLFLSSSYSTENAADNSSIASLRCEHS